LLDELETYLAHSPILYGAAHTMGGGGHPSSFVAALEGGVGVLVKTADASGDAPAMIRREAAAWRLARGLGWPGMVAATVIREVPSLGSGAPVEASVQILWPMNQPGVPEDEFSDDDLWRAAVIDALVRSTDRHPANWLGVPLDASSGRRQLKLIDHGHAFDLTRGVQAPFYVNRRGQELPDWASEAIGSLLKTPDFLGSYLSDKENEAFVQRLEYLKEGILDIKEP
jgi:hypothetical protein